MCFKKIYCLGLVLRDAGFKKQSKRVEQKTFSPAKKIVQQNRTHSTFTCNKKPCEHLVEVDSPFFEADNGIMNNFLQYFRRRDRLWFLFLWTFGQFNLLYPETILNQPKLFKQNFWMKFYDTKCNAYVRKPFLELS